MKRVVFATAAVGLAPVAISGASKAAPIAPLPDAVSAIGGNVVQAYYYYHHWYYW